MINWNLFREMDQMRREMDEIFNSVGLGSLLEPAFLPGLGARRTPRFNLLEDENNFYLSALLPGVDPKQLEMNVVGNSLTLSGERPEQVADVNATWHRRERGAGKFLRTIELPADVNPNKVSATYKNGVLDVTLPKAEAAKPKQIAIKVA
ncbi:Hsp20/alpha crystallin family protein [Geothermobacter hydrogeniphilus]|nr:Hsp20/alpha crystallin family protein [Geothermobacter hydrogeniphilus]